MKIIHTTQEKIGIMTAHLEGKPIECRHKLMKDWHGDANPAWDWANYEYRVKPQPKELWVVSSEGYPHENLSPFRDREYAMKFAHQLEVGGYAPTLSHYREVIE